MSGGTTQSAAGSQFRHDAFVQEMADRQPGEVKRALSLQSESGQAVYVKLLPSIVDFVSTCLLSISVLILRYPNSRIVEGFEYHRRKRLLSEALHPAITQHACENPPSSERLEERHGKSLYGSEYRAQTDSHVALLLYL